MQKNIENIETFVSALSKSEINQCMKNHGYMSDSSCASDSDSNEMSFDEMYAQLKPPPFDIKNSDRIYVHDLPEVCPKITKKYSEILKNKVTDDDNSQNDDSENIANGNDIIKSVATLSDNLATIITENMNKLLNDDEYPSIMSSIEIKRSKRKNQGNFFKKTDTLKHEMKKIMSPINVANNLEIKEFKENIISKLLVNSSNENVSIVEEEKEETTMLAMKNKWNETENYATFGQEVDLNSTEFCYNIMNLGNDFSTPNNFKKPHFKNDTSNSCTETSSELSYYSVDNNESDFEDCYEILNSHSETHNGEISNVEENKDSFKSTVSDLFVLDDNTKTSVEVSCVTDKHSETKALDNKRQSKKKMVANSLESIVISKILSDTIKHEMKESVDIKNDIIDYMDEMVKYEYVIMELSEDQICIFYNAAFNNALFLIDYTHINTYQSNISNCNKLNKHLILDISELISGIQNVNVFAHKHLNKMKKYHLDIVLLKVVVAIVKNIVHQLVSIFSWMHVSNFYVAITKSEIGTTKFGSIKKSTTQVHISLTYFNVAQNETELNKQGSFNYKNKVFKFRGN